MSGSADRLRLAPGASVAELHGEAIVLHLASGRYFSANGTGAALLRRLAEPGGATRDHLAHALMDAYRIDAARARADVDAWLARLSEQRLVEVEGIDRTDGTGGAGGADGGDRR